MSAALGEPSRRRMTQTSEFLRAEFRYGTASEISELYRDLAVACIQNQILRVLIVAGDDDAAGERALRDAASMMVLAGISTRFRLAVVVSSPRVAYAYRNTARDLNAAGVRTRLCEREDDALRWLDVENKAPRRAA